MKKIVVTVIGADRVGIVAQVARNLADTNINILDISQTIQDGIFSMVLICDMEKASVSLKEFQDKMAQMHGYSWQTYSMPCIAYEQED